MRNRWMLAALVISLAVNLALAGFVAGRMSMPGPVPAALDPSLGLFRVLRELPEARRQALGADVRAHVATMHTELRRMRGAQRRINEALTAEPFDPAALDAALQAFRQALLSSQEYNHELLVRVATDMTPRERRLLRDVMTRGHPHGPSRPEGREGPPPP